MKAMNSARGDAVPLAAATIKRLGHDARHVAETVRRKGMHLSTEEIDAEVAFAELHFDLGCWLHHYRLLVRQGGCHIRVDCVRRLFEAGFACVGDQFRLVFEFTARDFDACLGAGDGALVQAAVIEMACRAPASKLAACVRMVGWT